jgi:hypothetical protein
MSQQPALDLGEPPAAFSEEELMVVLALAKPIEKDRRNAYLKAVAGALAASRCEAPVLLIA